MVDNLFRKARHTPYYRHVSEVKHNEKMLKWLKHWLGLPHTPASIPPQRWETVKARLPFLAWLPPHLDARLQQLTVEFLAGKEFYGAHGLELTDEMMLSIAAQACLPILRSGIGTYRDWVGVVVYPGDFVVVRHDTDDTGVVHEYEDELIGETWPGGPVLVSWFDETLPDVNVIIHEFAHKLDMENSGAGEANGLPRLPAGMSQASWAKAFSTAYAHFCAQVDSGTDTALDPYAAEHPAEFFAVAMEAFFCTPIALRAAFPAVYAQLSTYYEFDPAAGESAQNRKTNTQTNIRKEL
jgi:Mlc titration factor MtfA (ptsG expression regulator)